MAQTDHRSERLRRQAEQKLAGYSGLPAWQRQVLAQFLVETRQGWHTYVRKALSETPDERPDVLLVGPMGVLAILLRDELPGGADTTAAFRFAGDLFLGARLPAGNVSEAVVRPVVVVPPEHPMRSTTDVLAVTAGELDRVLHRGQRRLNKRDAQVLVEHLENKTGEYERHTLTEQRSDPDSGGELFSAADIQQDRFDSALSGPFESWLTFLDDSQFAMVRRDYNGPARISGPAGTGKSVVALHRLVRLAKRTTGPLLFTTYARNLPPIMQRNFGRLAPEFAERVQFRTLHSWALALLQQRGIDFEVGDYSTCFSLAWKHVGKNSKLDELNPNPNYWWDEIDRVIKGRGLTDLADYQAVQRVGRGLRLDRADRELMWQLHTEYERVRQERNRHDFNDLLNRASEELGENPLDPPYAAVVVDEVQDITLVGLRLLRELAGDGPNALMLVGDGQQQIYAGGWRLSDAGIPIRGRGEVLRTNYRNASRILDLAKQYDATNQVDDLDGAPGFALREAVATLRGGDVVPWQGSRSEHEVALVDAVRALGDVERDDIAVLTFSRSEAEQWRRALRSAGLRVEDLDHFEGERNDKIKIGTVYRAKGMEFRAVFVPELPDDRATDERSREWLERGQRACLVALTRARDHLWLGFPKS